MEVEQLPSTDGLPIGGIVLLRKTMQNRARIVLIKDTSWRVFCNTLPVMPSL